MFSPHEFSPPPPRDDRPAQGFSGQIRPAQHRDLVKLAEILASSFHGQTGMAGFVYPLLRFGIQEDIRSRLKSREPYYTCLVATQDYASRSDASWSVGGSRTTERSEVTNDKISQLFATDRSPLSFLSLMQAGGDRLVGTVELSVKPHSFWSAPQSRFLYLSNLAVDVAFRRQGIAQQLLQTCEQIATNWGFTDIYLHVLENNHQARRLYMKAGYRLQRVEVGLGCWLLGQPRQLFLRKQLNR